MITRYVEVIIQLFSIGLVIAAAGLWAGAGLDMRPKYRDEQTLVGGTIWSQIIIPIGLMISKIVDEELNRFVEGYFVLSGVALLISTGGVLVLHEIGIKKRRRQRLSSVTSNPLPRLIIEKSDRIYFAIGVICLIAAAFNILITGLLAFGAYWTTKYLMNMPEPTSSTTTSATSTASTPAAF